MMDLTAFLAENVEQAEHIKYAASSRIKADGKAVEWEIRPLTSAEDDEVRASSMKRVPIPGRKGQYTNEMDMNAYLGKMAAAATVFPNLNDASLQASYKVNGADNLLKAMLTAGEYMNYVTKVQEVCGFTPITEDVETAKN